MMIKVRRGTLREMPNLCDLRSAGDRRCHLVELPFEMVLVIASFCAAEESFNMIRVSRELRSYTLAAKMIVYRQLFGRP